MPANMEVTPAIKCERVSKMYSQGNTKVFALSNINIQVLPGEFLAFSGPSGSGKTTLLNLVGGLDSVTDGTITLGAHTITGMSRSELAKLRLFDIGYVFQSYNLIPVLSALENVEFVMQLQGVGSKERVRRAREILAEVGLESLEDRRPGELSGGQQQRVAVARAVVSRPGLVLADEPTANLDSKTAGKLLELMRKMNQLYGVTFIFSTHDPRVLQHARRIVGLEDGRITSDKVCS